MIFALFAMFWAWPGCTSEPFRGGQCPHVEHELVLDKETKPICRCYT